MVTKRQCGTGGSLLPIKQGFVGGVVFGPEPQSIHRTPIALVNRIPRAHGRALCGRCGAGARAKPRAVFCASSTPVQACRPAPVH